MIEVLLRFGAQFSSSREITPRDHSEATAREVDLAVRGLLDTAFGRAVKLLEGRRADLEKGAALLMERETITPEDFAPLRSAG